MKTKNQRTKIIRVRGGESYFERIEYDDGTRWLEFHKDKSALFKHCHDTKFRDTSLLRREPKPFSDPIIPIPEDFATDLLSPYARLQYAKGHEPIKPLRLR
jgi:hypothetical protein